MSKLQPLDPLEEIARLHSRRTRENELKRKGFYKREYEVYAREDWGEWYTELIAARMAVRKKAIFNAYDKRQYQEAVRNWYKRNKWTDPSKKVHGRSAIAPWKAVAFFRDKWKAAHPNEPTSPPPPLLTPKQIKRHEEFFRKRYKEKNG